jgi:hypothetical protein
MKERRKYYKRSKDYVPTVYKPTDLAYMAGLVDGEGCFFMCKLPKKKGDGYVTEHYRGLLKIDNTDPSLLDWIDETFSGTASARCRFTSSRKFERQVFTWTATGDRLLDLCEQILPYLTIKKKQCLLMIKFRKTYTAKLGSNKLSEEAIAIRQICLEDIRKLNSRWHLHPLKHNTETESLVPVTGSYATASKLIREDL